MINIATPSHVCMLSAMECNWVYADDDLEAFHLISDALKKSRLLVSAEVFQQAALDIHAPFVNWVDECMSTAPRNYWLVTPLSKNPFESDLFLHLTWMILIEKFIKQGKNDLIVVTNSHGLTSALTELCRIRGWEFKCYGKTNNIFRHWRRNLTALAKWFGKLLLLSYRMAAVRSVFTNEYVTARLASTELLLETYILDGDLAEDGSFKDRYFPGLMAYYQSCGIRASYFPHFYRIPFSRIRQTYTAMKGSQTAFVPFEAFITPYDLAMAAWASISHALFPRLQASLAFQGMPVNPLVRAECFTSGLRGFMPLVLERAPRRMAKAGIKPKWFIDWFENQTLDKGVILGFNESLPDCHTIAVRQYVPLSNFLSLHSSSGEVSAGVAPRENWICGEALKPIISRYDLLGAYSVVPALRYSHIHRPYPAPSQCETLLVLLTHSLEESMVILDCVTPLVRDKEAGVSRFVVKTHPTMNLALFQQKVKRRFPALEINIVEWTNVELSELLPTAKVVVTSGSSAALEAICRGVPVVLIGRQAGLNFNPLIWVDSKMWTVAYTRNDLKKAITQQFCEERLPLEERRTIAENTRKAFFMETGNNEMRFFLPAGRSQANACTVHRAPQHGA